ncbi:MAG: hypothetical protein DMG34_17320 [Acidobacteria bacterium]|nr:MAG: hypothetical protein DMG34_17320 [Acidobacteriota bacterium]
MTGTPAILNNVRTVWRNCAITNGPAARTKRFERTPLNSLNNETREYARSLIEASLDPLVTISPEGKITEWSRTRVHAFENSTKNEGPVIAAKSNHEQYRCRLESLTLTMLPSRPIFLRVFSASISTRRYHHFRRPCLVSSLSPTRTLRSTMAMRGLCFRVSPWSDASKRQAERID